jgi:hypothetical protein
MNSNLVKAAAEVIPNPKILVSPDAVMQVVEFPGIGVAKAKKKAA